MGKPIVDPDGYGPLGFCGFWKKSAFVRGLEELAPGWSAAERFVVRRCFRESTPWRRRSVSPREWR